MYNDFIQIWKGVGHFCGLVHAIGHDIHEFPFKYIEQRFSKD